MMMTPRTKVIAFACLFSLLFIMAQMMESFKLEKDSFAWTLFSSPAAATSSLRPTRMPTEAIVGAGLRFITMAPSELMSNDPTSETQSRSNTPVPTISRSDTPVLTISTSDTPMPTISRSNTAVPTISRSDTPVPTISRLDTPVPTISRLNTPVPTISRSNDDGSSSKSNDAGIRSRLNTPMPTIPMPKDVGTQSWSNSPMPTIPMPSDDEILNACKAKSDGNSRRPEPEVCGSDDEPVSKYPQFYRNDVTGIWSDVKQHHRLLPSESTPVFYFMDKFWGQLCTRIGVTAGVFHELRGNRNGVNYSIALGPNISEAIYHLDMHAVSRNVPALYLDCFECRKSEQDPITFVRCHTMFVDGIEYPKLDGYYLRVNMTEDVHWSFFYYTQADVGYMPELAYEFIPSLKMRSAVERASAQIRSEMKGELLVGMHRRFMDGLCVDWMVRETYENFDCAVTREDWINEQIRTMQEYTTSLTLRTKLPYLNNFTMQYEVEQRFPIAFPCNYTLDAAQIAFLVKEWPEVFNPNKRLSFLIADDGQTEAGLKEMKHSERELLFLKDFAPKIGIQEPCLFGSRTAISDMYAMATSDVHMGQPFSSCDSIVAIWRNTLHKTRGSSFPQYCYDGFYQNNATATSSSLPDTMQPSKSPTSAEPEAYLPFHAPSFSPTTQRPTKTPSRAISEIERSCLRRPIPFSKLFDFTCDKPGREKMKSSFPKFYRNDDTGKWFKNEKQHSRHPNPNPLPPIVYFVDTKWGQQCNRLEMTAGVLHHTRSQNKSYALALGRHMSEAVYLMDLEALSQNLPALFLDCVECRNSETESLNYIRCGSMIIEGKITDVSNRVLTIDEWIHSVPAYWEMGPARVGFMEEIAYEFIPNERLRATVEHLMQKHLESSNLLLSVHRRFMDGKCFRWFSQFNAENDCELSATKEMVSYEFVQRYNRYVAMNQQIWNEQTPGQEQIEYQVLQALPFMSICNYTFEPYQMEYFREAFQEAFGENLINRKKTLFVADDGQTPKGLHALRTSGVFDKIITMDSLAASIRGKRVFEPCLKGNNGVAMLADAWALALSGYSMGNPLSSCDSMVAMWRSAMKKFSNSSYPRWCYEGFYKSNVG